LEIVMVMLPKKEGEFHLREFGRLPVLLNGRVQPFDTVARNSLLQIRSTGDVPLEQVPSWKFWHHPRKLKSTEWLLEVMTKPEVADTRPIFLIHHSELLGELKLEDKGIEKSGLRYYTFNELRPVYREISEQGRKASELKSEQQTTFQKQVIKLANAVMLYQRLKVSLQPEGAHDFAAELSGFSQKMEPVRAALLASEQGREFDKEAIRKVAEPLRQYETMAQYGYPLLIPPLEPDKQRENWQNTGASLMDSIRLGQVHPAMSFYATMATAYHHGKPEVFNRALAEYKAWLAPNFPGEIRKGRAEFYYNDVKAFLHATIIYIFAFVLGGGALVCLTLLPGLSEALRRSAFYLVVLAGVVHTFGLVFRMVLEGRPPVTNLYSSAIFIGWGTMVLGLILEWMYRVGIGVIVASVVGFVTLLIAHNLALGGDTMEMLRAVLDTNFWLATHVVVITLGYAAVFAAGLLAILYIVLGLATPLLGRKLEPAAAQSGSRPGKSAGGEISIGKALSKMVYGIICFATLFSFLGTVLGGIWADQSWGRFWGWDPKENGALLIVLWCAIILHARWGGLVRDRGIMNLTIFGNIVTAFSWFGVNMLGVGLHSYGFMDAAFKWLMIFNATQLFFIALGLIPLRYWRSFRVKSPATPASSAVKGGGRAPSPATT
jgi:cytochrome c-type biogenesis protein CcsB